MKIVRVNAQRGPRVPRLTPQERAARAAIEKSLSRYIHLKCDHYTTPQTQMMYASAKPKRGVFWCEKCNRWLGVFKLPKPPGWDSDVPLF